MIWHIFKKDWKLLWQWVVAAALLNALQRIIVTITSGPGVRSPAPQSIADMLEAVSLMAIAVLTAIVVQNDALSGLRQDWLVRPIRRGDLLLSKILFIVLLVQGPILLFEVVQGLNTGFSLSASLDAALSHGLWMLLALDLPVIAFATLTRSLSEAIAGGTVVFLGLEILSALNQIRGAGRGMFNDSLGTGIGWVTDSVQLTSVFLATAVILALQYFRRKTTTARWTFCFATLLWMASGMLPWQPAFAIQEQLSAQPATANPVRITFAPGLGKFKRRPGEFDPRRYEYGGAVTADVVVYLPLAVDGAGDGQSLAIDRLTARLTGPDGKPVEMFSAAEPGSPTWVAHQPMWVSEDAYNRVKDRPARAELDYSLTLMSVSAAQTIPAMDGDRRVPEVGWCVTKTVLGETQIDLHCVAPGQQPCVLAFLESPRTGKRTNAQNRGCGLDYSPYFGHIMGDSMSRSNRYFPFRDPSGLFQYPVDESQLKDARVVMEVYRPLAHFTRHVVIPDIRLSDWRAE